MVLIPGVSRVKARSFYPLIFSADAEAHGRVRFLGFGIHAPEHNWDDY